MTKAIDMKFGASRLTVSATVTVNVGPERSGPTHDIDLSEPLVVVLGRRATGPSVAIPVTVSDGGRGWAQEDITEDELKRLITVWSHLGGKVRVAGVGGPGLALLSAVVNQGGADA